MQVPQHFYDKFGFIANETGPAADKANHPRQIYHAMVNFADTALGNITDKLKQKGWWDEALVVFSTDNGGPVCPYTSIVEMPQRSQCRNRDQNAKPYHHALSVLP